MDFFLNEGEKPLKKLETTVFTPKFVYIFQKKQLQRFFLPLLRQFIYII